MGDFAQLGGRRRVQLRHPVAEGRDPQARYGVEVAATVDVDQLTPFRPIHDDRPALGVGGHLGEAVPDDRGIPLDPAH